MSRKFYSWFGLAALAVLLIALNIFSYTALRGARVDLTEKKLYTLSEGTLNILKQMDEPLTLQYYYSRDLIAEAAPQLATYGSTVQELLEEYRDNSGGKLKLEVINPESFSEEEDAAALAGLQNIPTERGDSIFMGLVGKNSVDDTEIIAFFDPRKETTLEYDITRLVHDLAHPEKKTVGIISSLPVMGDNDMFAALRQPNQVRQPYIVMTQLQQLYDLKTIASTETSIPDDVDVLMVIHPKELNDDLKYAIDQFVLKGGHALVFVDPHAERDEPPYDPANPYNSLWASRASSLDPLLKSWGVEVVKNKFVADKENAQRVSIRNERGMAEAVDYLAYLALKQEEMNRDDVVTNELSSINVGSVGAIKKIEDATTTVTPLLESSAESMLMDVDRIKFTPQFEEMRKEFKPEEKYTIAARISGKIKSAYPDGKVGDDTEPREGHVAESEQDANIILVADADILSDHFWVQVQDFLGQRIAIPMAQNGLFVMNAVENLAGSNDLISIRSRGETRRSFNRVEELAKAAQEKYQNREAELQERIATLQNEINEIQAKRDDNSILFTPEQQQAIEKAREEFTQARKELRAVQRDLNRDIDKLGWKVKFINIAAIPLLISLYAVALGLFRLTRRKA